MKRSTKFLAVGSFVLLGLGVKSVVARTTVAAPAPSSTSVIGNVLQRQGGSAPVGGRPDAPPPWYLDKNGDLLPSAPARMRIAVGYSLSRDGIGWIQPSAVFARKEAPGKPTKPSLIYGSETGDDVIAWYYDGFNPQAIGTTLDEASQGGR
jgi:hypothetical protein